MKKQYNEILSLEEGINISKAWLNKENSDAIKNIVRYLKDTNNVLSQIANLKTENIFQARDIAKAALKRFEEMI